MRLPFASADNGSSMRAMEHRSPFRDSIGSTALVPRTNAPRPDDYEAHPRPWMGITVLAALAFLLASVVSCVAILVA